MTPSFFKPTILITAISKVLDWTLINKSEKSIRTDITINKALTKLKIKLTINIPISNV